ncbi:hypothetical protein [Mangrovimonas sp. DI 80]|uniref:hypothetical protein n=1 Tax=Mangrovimonas sp. DI 80 TaxID=1779330 RepID=UPI0015C56142|nr:hypothetical protein [Mangrovimonas sp. DI 80]
MKKFMINVRVTRTQMDGIEQMRHAKKQTVSEYIRGLIDQNMFNPKNLKKYDRS